MATAKKSAAAVWQTISDLVLDNQRRKAVTEATGMSFARTRAIRRVAGRPLSMRELADALGIDPPNATVLVNELENQDLVRRRPNPDDRRSTLVEATSKGAAIARLANEILDTPPPELTALSKADLQELERIFASMPSRIRSSPK